MKTQMRFKPNYPILIAKLNLKGVSDGLSRCSVSSTCVTHEDQHVLGPLCSNLHQLHGAILVIIEVSLVRAPPLVLAAFAAMIVPSNLLEHLLCYRLPGGGHGDHHVRRNPPQSNQTPDKNLPTLTKTQLNLTVKLPFPPPGMGIFRQRKTEQKQIPLQRKKEKEFDYWYKYNSSINEMCLCFCECVCIG